MKKTTTIYWILTGLFAAFMLFSAIPDIICTPEAVTFMHTHLSYPVYFISFIGIAKALGVIAILVPGFPRVKEWAYAGLSFDLIGAVYSLIAVDGFSGGIFFMFIPLALAAGSYVFYHKRSNLQPQVA
jgi:hypothetical protein